MHDGLRKKKLSMVEIGLIEILMVELRQQKILMVEMRQQ